MGGLPLARIGAWRLTGSRATDTMRVQYDDEGKWTVSKDGQPFQGYNPTPDQNAWDYVKSMHEQRGAVIYSSEWVGWVPVDDCGTSSGDLYGSSFSVSNLVISGSVVQGPEPARCGAPPAPTPKPTPAPIPTPALTPMPSDCPGGSLDACIDLCPVDAFVACVKSCQQRCIALV